MHKMIAGGVLFVIGCALTLLSGFQTLYWGAILAGGIGFFWGLVQFIEDKTNSSKPPDQ